MRALGAGLFLLLLTACPGPAPVPDGGVADAGAPDAGLPDAGPVDAGLPPFNRTLVTRALMPTSALNLLRDPFIGGDGSSSYGQFRAFYVSGASLPLTRTFRSVSPIGGAVSIEELRDLPADAGTATSIRVLSSFLGGPGNAEASLWLSAGDSTAAPVPFSRASAGLVVTLIDNIGMTESTLVAGAPVQYGNREWVQLKTPGAVPMPHGGWLMLTLTDFTLTLQLAAPEVTSSTVTQPHHPLHLRPPSDEDRRALLQARQYDAPPRDHVEP